MSKDNNTSADDDDVEIILEEIPAPHTIETGDSVKVKQVLDDATVEGIKGAGYVINYKWENFKLFIMFISCVFAMLAQFYPIPFPKSRPLLGSCCAMYFILSGVLQFIVTFIDKDTILFTYPKNDDNNNSTDDKLPLQIRTSFPRFQEYFTLIIQFKNDKKLNKNNNTITTAKMYVGRYFTTKGEFDEESYIEDVKSVVKRFEEKEYKILDGYDKYKKNKSD